MKIIINKIVLISVRILIKFYKYFNKRQYNPRYWSNDQLRKFAHLFKGDIINVSAGKDNDKENHFYRDYFINKKSYTVSNYIKTDNQAINEVIIDLEKEIPDELKPKFDVVFSHTVLEHIYHIDKAIENLCKLSKDIVITVVPFLQTYHHIETQYFDYWRFSPLALIRKFNAHKFKTLYIDWNNDAFGNIYIFHIASCKSEIWKEIEKHNKTKSKKAPGYTRNKLLTSSKSNFERTIINTLDEFIEKQNNEKNI